MVLTVNKLVERVAQNIADQKLLAAKNSCLVAVSGGVDSMVLLHLLHSIARKNRWALAVAHFNHGLRGRSSNADQRLVESAAKKFGLRCFSGDGDVKALARDKGISIEMAARDLRHRFLAVAARESGIKRIAMAHHADDQVELFFLRLMRGAGSEGLAGMKWMSASFIDPAIMLVRPFLNIRKQEIHNYAQSQSVRYREDQSNQSLDISRNRIRHELLPLLEKHFQPALRQVILRTMTLLEGEREFVENAAVRWGNGEDKTTFEKLSLAMKRACLRSQLQNKGIDSDFALIEKLLARPETAVSLNTHQTVLRTSQGQLTVRSVGGACFSGKRKTFALKKRRGTVAFAGMKFDWALEPHRADGNSWRKEGCEHFDVDKIGSEIVLRHWEQGDRFHPLGNPAPGKLQDIFTNLKVPREERHRRIVAATSKGAIIWVEGLRISEAFKLDKRTHTRLEWSWKR